MFKRSVASNLLLYCKTLVDRLLIKGNFLNRITLPSHFLPSIWPSRQECCFFLFHSTSSLAVGYFIWRGITASCICKEILNEMNLSPSSQGNNCEIEVNECLSQPCQNGASCSDELNSFSCLCPAGTTGTLFLLTVAVSQDEFGWQRPHNYILKLTTMFKCRIDSLKLNFRMVTQYRSHSLQWKW